MKVNELRIGNYIWEDYGGVDQISSIMNDGEIRCIRPGFKTEGQYNIKYVIPIPLTEEWLIKFGFEQSEGWDDFEYFKLNGIEFTDVSPNGYELCEMEQCCIKEVHQLQNLYFALTGEELKTKI